MRNPFEKIHYPGMSPKTARRFLKRNGVKVARAQGYRNLNAFQRRVRVAEKVLEAEGKSERIS